VAAVGKAKLFLLKKLALGFENRLLPMPPILSKMDLLLLFGPDVEKMEGGFSSSG